MAKIPKEIVNKLQQVTDLKEELANWFRENLDVDGCDLNSAVIVGEPVGIEQGTPDCKEWSDQTTEGEDWHYGHYYWETEEPKKYLRMWFDM